MSQLISKRYPTINRALHHILLSQARRETGSAAHTCVHMGDRSPSHVLKGYVENSM